MPVPVFNDAVSVVVCPESIVDGDGVTVITGSGFMVSDPVPVTGLLVTPSESVTVTLIEPDSLGEDDDGV